jgi:hypothetical protein
MKFLLTSHFSLFQNYWKHRGTEKTEEGDFTEKIVCQGKYCEIALLFGRCFAADIPFYPTL